MSGSRTPHERFAALVAGHDDFDLARAALYIAQLEYPDLDVERYLDRLDAMANEVAAWIGPDAGDVDRVDALCRYLFDEIGFVGNDADYYDPRNSFLNEVLERRTGIPITLSIVLLEVGWRLKLPLSGVGLPGHFVVRADGLPDGALFIDAFDRGRRLTEEGCAQLLANRFGSQVRFRPEHLNAVTRLQIIQRVLNNLKAIYIQREDDGRAIGVIDFLLAIDPAAPIEVRDRGLLEARRGRYTTALRELARFLELDPNSPDRQFILDRIADLKQLIGRLN